MATRQSRSRPTAAAAAALPIAAPRPVIKSIRSKEMNSIWHKPPNVSAECMVLTGSAKRTELQAFGRLARCIHAKRQRTFGGSHVVGSAVLERPCECCRCRCPLSAALSRPAFSRQACSPLSSCSSLHHAHTNLIGKLILTHVNQAYAARWAQNDDAIYSCTRKSLVTLAAEANLYVGSQFPGPMSEVPGIAREVSSCPAGPACSIGCSWMRCR